MDQGPFLKEGDGGKGRRPLPESLASKKCGRSVVSFKIQIKLICYSFVIIIIIIIKPLCCYIFAHFLRFPMNFSILYLVLR